METAIIRKISKGTRFNQIYLQKNELGFEPGRVVLITSLQEAVLQKPLIFEHNIKLSGLKRKIVEDIFSFLNKKSMAENIIVSGSFINEGYNFGDVDIILLTEQRIEEKVLEKELESKIEIKVHLIIMPKESFTRGLKRDPLFRLMAERFVSSKKIAITKDIEINYRLLDAHLAREKNLVDGFELLSIKQRLKMLRSIVAIKLFVEKKEICYRNIDKETERLFGKELLEKLFYYGSMELKKKFISKLEKEFEKIQEKVIQNAAKQT